jgi:hypothetical protein
MSVAAFSAEAVAGPLAPILFYAPPHMIAVKTISPVVGLPVARPSSPHLVDFGSQLVHSEIRDRRVPLNQQEADSR